MQPIVISSAVTIQGPNISGTLTDGRGFTTFAPSDPGLVGRLTEKGVRVVATSSRQSVAEIKRRIERALVITHVPPAPDHDAAGVAAAFKGSRKPQLDHPVDQAFAQQVGRQTQNVRIVVAAAHFRVREGRPILAAIVPFDNVKHVVRHW